MLKSAISLLGQQFVMVVGRLSELAPATSKIDEIAERWARRRTAAGRNAGRGQ
jgi:hypothetical protein